MKTRVLVSKVAGVSYENRQAHLARLTGREPLRIEPEPTNPYDPNALAVKVAVDGEILHCGYIPKDLAKQIAPLLAGENVMVSSFEITGGFETNTGEIAALGMWRRVEIPVEDGVV